MATLSVLPGVLPELTPLCSTATPRSYERVREVIPELEWQTHLPWIDAIHSLKKTARRRNPRAQLSGP